MPSPLRFLQMILSQQMGRQRLARRPEPDEVTDAVDDVLDYDRVMTTKLVLAYAAGIEVIHRARPDEGRTRALDLACGPGHFTTSLVRYLDYGSVTGVDLSEPMVATANENASKLGLDDRLSFRTGDARQLKGFDDGTFDLSCFTDAAHHMPDIGAVRDVLNEMSRVTRPDGLVMLMDLARLRTEKLTERYVETLGADYRERNLTAFLKQFRDSMYAAWTVDELAQATPRDAARTWWQIVPRGLPSMQFLLGIPRESTGPFHRKAYPVKKHPLLTEWFPRWSEEVGEPWANANRADWKMLRMTLGSARKRRIA